MRTLSLHRLFHALLMCSLVSVGLLVVGCDSGGSNGGDSTNLKGSVTVELTEASSSSSNAKATLDGEFTATFTYVNESDSDCNEFARIDVSGDTPYKDELSPTLNRCEGNDFDEVEVSYVPSSGSASGLSLSVLSNGNEVAAVSSPNATGNLSVTASDETNDGNDEDNGDAGSGSVPSSLTGNWKVTETTQEDVDLSKVDLFYSISSDQIDITIKGESFCETDMETITNVDGNTITTDDNDGDSPSDATFDITDGGNTLTVEGIEGSTVTATRVDSVPDCS